MRAVPLRCTVGVVSLFGILGSCRDGGGIGAYADGLGRGRGEMSGRSSAAAPSDSGRSSVADPSACVAHAAGGPKNPLATTVADGAVAAFPLGPASASA